MPDSTRPDYISVITAILARGFLRYWKFGRLRQSDTPQNALDSDAEQSRHVTVANDQRTDEN